MACAAVSVNCLLGRAAGTFTLQVASALLRPRPLCVCGINRKMSSRRKTDHLERTANIYRQEVLYPAKVCGILNESNNVKRLRLAIPDKDFTFKAGQWVDFFIPGLSKVGGFSICSSPGLLEGEGVIELAVKYSAHPPAHWIHTECTLDSEIAVRVGGDFYFDPRPSDPAVNLLLVAGGVGINPLFSILLHVADLYRERAREGSGYEPCSVKLFYSAKNTEELLFKNTIIGLSKEFSEKVSCNFHVTQQETKIDTHLRPYISEGRISQKILKEHLSENTLCFVCGPPPMIEYVSGQLQCLGLSEEKILFEKWW
ncbi:OXND1 protein, partial [Atractosteus spatula]|nr:OXND1 protein [Atractosteus spatula]